MAEVGQIGLLDAEEVQCRDVVRAPHDEQDVLEKGRTQGQKVVQADDGPETEQTVDNECEESELQ